jgi:hypothetical protein
MSIRSWMLRNQLWNCLLDMASIKRFGGRFKVCYSPPSHAVLALIAPTELNKKDLPGHLQVMMEASHNMKKMCYNFEIDRLMYQNRNHLFFFVIITMF